MRPVKGPIRCRYSVAPCTCERPRFTGIEESDLPVIAFALGIDVDTLIAWALREDERTP